jgi:MFS superfamily sulfate permease-like transporter
MTTRVSRSLLSVVGFLDSIVSAKQNSGRFGYSISPNRELVALGAANIAGSLVPGTLPAYGSITRLVIYSAIQLASSDIADARMTRSGRA